MEAVNEIVQNRKKLSNSELRKLDLAIMQEKNERAINKILKAAKKARLDSNAGKNYVATTPEEIIVWFKDVLND